jgi:hypothetical protein
MRFYDGGDDQDTRGDGERGLDSGRCHATALTAASHTGAIRSESGEAVAPVKHSRQSVRHF